MLSPGWKRASPPNRPTPYAPGGRAAGKRAAYLPGVRSEFAESAPLGASTGATVDAVSVARKAAPFWAKGALDAIEVLAGVSAQYHRATLSGAENLPSGGALLVGNHGYFGLETPAFFYLLKKHTGRYAVGLAEKRLFKLPVLGRVLPHVGGLNGTKEEALRALDEDKLVVCYPGGAYEVFKEPSRRYSLAWNQTTGFVRVAAEGKKPVVPFAGYGIDDTYAVLPKRVLSLRLTPSAKYEMPVGLGIGLLPLPARFRFRIGEPLEPPREGCSERVMHSFRTLCAQRVRRLLLEAAHA